jgi:hypothetical protein
LRQKAAFLAVFILSISPVQAAEEATAPKSFLPIVPGLTEPVNVNDKLEMKFGIESRYRFELRDDFTLNERTYEDDAFHLIRNRLNANLQYRPDHLPSLRLFAEMQDSHSFAESQINKTASFTDALDLRQLFLETGHFHESFPVKAVVGRQELPYGDKRLLGSSKWSNVAALSDAVKMVWQPSDWFQGDLFFSRPVRARKYKPNHSVHSDNLYGIYTAMKKIPDHVLDTYFLVRHNRDAALRGERTGESGPLKEYTFGNRFKGETHHFDYATEYAVQLGSRAHNSIAAWMFHQDLGYTFSDTLWTPRLSGEFNHASGDRNPADGTFSTFDNLFPSEHEKYGLIDIITLRNLNHFRIGMDFVPHERVSWGADFHWFFLDAKESAWFSSNTATFRAANPNASRQLGEEIDVFLKILLTEQLDLLIGYSHFFAGPFAKDTGSADDCDFFFAQLEFKI